MTNAVMVAVYVWSWTLVEYTVLPLVWFNIAVQWTGQLILDITKWSIGIW